MLSKMARIYASVMTGLMLVVFVVPHLAVATPTADELRNKIETRKSTIKQLEQDIKKYTKELTETRGKKRTLQSAVKSLDISKKRTEAEINLTERKIHKTRNKIQTLTEQIQDYRRRITLTETALARALRNIDRMDANSFVETFLRYDNIADAWTAEDSLIQFQATVTEHTHSLKEARERLESARAEREREHKTLEGEVAELETDKRTLEINKRAKETLLHKTKNKESEYQRILAAKRKAKEEFEAQMRQFEAQLKYVLDRSKIPGRGSKIFTWPVKHPYITQYFGNTKFARSGAYNGRGHNGVDFRAPIGTPIFSVLGGVVQETNEKVAAHCQYGKWVLVKHDNGLTSLYAHLSKISVRAGQRVSQKQLLGYAGDTGYAFGPHLHLSVYASDAVKFKNYRCKSSGIVVRVPISAYSGYLNPMDYF